MTTLEQLFGDRTAVVVPDVIAAPHAATVRERFERTGDRLSGALVFRLAGLRFDYALTLAGDRTVRLEQDGTGY